MIQPKWRNLEKSRWTVRQQWLVVTRPSADCQTTFFGRFKQFEIFWKKSLNGHATVVGGHASVGRLSNNVSCTFQTIWIFFEKSHWTVTRPWSEVTRPSADCQTTFFERFKQFEIFLKKVTERSRDSSRRSRDRRPTGKQRFLDVSSNLKFFWKRSLNGHATVVGGHATVGQLSNNVFVRFKQFEIFWKKVTERSRESGRRSRDRRPTVKQRFLDVSSNLKFFWKKSLNGHATVVGGHATVGRLSNNVFWTFRAIWNFFEKSHWTVTRQWSEVTRPSADCQTTFFGRFKQFEIFLKKVTERSRDRGRRSRDRRLTVKHIYAWIRERERERERERKRDYLRYTSYGHRHVVPLAVSSAGVPVEASSYTGRRSAGTASLWIL